MQSEGKGFIGRMVAGAKALPLGWWLLAAAITSGTNTLDFVAAAEPDGKRSAFFAAAAALRIALIFWLAYALLRKLAGAERPMRIGMPFLRLSLYMIATIVVVAAAGALGAFASDGDPLNPFAVFVSWIAMSLAGIALVRLYAWQTALAVGDRTLGLQGGWRSLAGCHIALALAYLPIAAIALVHSLLTRLALSPGRSRDELFALAACDGILSAVQLVLSASLAVQAYRTAKAGSGALREGGGLA